MKSNAGLTTNPIAVDDGESTTKVNLFIISEFTQVIQEAKLVTSAFDRTKYQTKKGVVQNCSVYMITSNIMFRYIEIFGVLKSKVHISSFRQERTGDREHIQVYHQYHGTPEEEGESLKLVIKA